MSCKFFGDALTGREIAARLLVAADGAKSRLRELAGIGTVGWPYHQAGIVTTVGHERGTVMGEWLDKPA